MVRSEGVARLCVPRVVRLGRFGALGIVPVRFGVAVSGEAAEAGLAPSRFGQAWHGRHAWVGRAMACRGRLGRYGLARRYEAGSGQDGPARCGMVGEVRHGRCGLSGLGLAWRDSACPARHGWQGRRGSVGQCADGGVRLAWPDLASHRQSWPGMARCVRGAAGMARTWSGEAGSGTPGLTVVGLGRAGRAATGPGPDGRGELGLGGAGLAWHTVARTVRRGW